MKVLSTQSKPYPFNSITFQSANDGDQVSIEILEKAGENMARSVAGCIDNLNYVKPVNVIMAGSVWVHATSDYMVNSFKKWVNDLTKRMQLYHLKSPTCNRRNHLGNGTC